MKPQSTACCSSLATMSYWLLISLAAWVVLSILGIYWHPLYAPSAQTILIAMAIGCAANWLKNRTLHCGITFPLFLIAGILFLLANMRAIQIRPNIIWAIVFVGTGIAFLLEWRYSR